ncbi:putative AraC family transcriptional regulator [Gordonia araii NBRC 100433]|uniref:Putative AraC family transcriptional regulator n=1 Tax=Gordonia araii NBRC 100433 TaxID=1073574 RepID=G7H4L5_9ACTN|nr:helix-turn-helix domain-containing protein [Gordonia araii]NNG96153.1 AraC family transcriptional regulator [Gordonia araii NBRC 100433]GAB10790.1 putative AraC family transcriptional regulator [Gordonia araii NBRC 100433]
MVDPSRGVLYPAKLPTLTRLAPPPLAAELVGWFWIPEWQIAAGRSSRQELVPFPASNLVVELDHVGFTGPATTISHRDLTGTGWAVGALLRPAGVAALIDDPGAYVDSYQPFEAADLHDAVFAAMTDGDAATRHSRAITAFADWLADRVPEPSDEARLANAMADLLMSDPTILRLDDAAQALASSPRTLQRLARRYVGLSPSAMIRRRRLQEAAQLIRDDPAADLASIAADLGYTDHAHLSNDFRSVLAFSPSAYRGTVHPN